MNQIDIHADDYALSMNASRIILQAVNQGQLHSTSILPNMSCFEEAAELWKSELKEGMNPHLSIHLNFMEGYSCSEPKKVSLLTDENGLFTVGWIGLVKYDHNRKKRKEVKAQLKTEIRAQIQKVAGTYRLGEKGQKLRIDSHQHTHMIPLVMEALLEVIDEDRLAVEFIRNTREDWRIYLTKPGMYPTYRLINIIKVILLNWYSYRNEKLLKNRNLTPMVFFGLLFSGKMDYERVSCFLPGLQKRCEKKGRMLEVTLHPGGLLEEEISGEFNDPSSLHFYLSKGREIEKDTLEKMRRR